MPNDPPPLARPDLYVVARFLEKLVLRGGRSKKTRLQMAVGVNYNVFVRYLALMEQKGLITVREEQGGTSEVSLTSKGFEVQEQLLSLLHDTFGRP